MKIDILNELSTQLAELTNTETGVIKNKLIAFFANYDITEKKNEIVVYEGNNNELYVKKFLVTKLAEGRTKRTLEYYKVILKKFFEKVNKPCENIVADDVIYYLADMQLNHNISKVTCNNERRVLNSFFTYLLSRDIINKSPMRSISKIKEDKLIKLPLTAVEIEVIRNAFHKHINNLKANKIRFNQEKYYLIFELLLSTGMRVDELVNIECGKVDMINGEILIMGKGRKERIVYLNPKTKLMLSDYLKTHEKYYNNRKWLFPSRYDYSKHAEVGGVERFFREMGKQVSININIHPHKLRRTFATTALNRGMPIDQVAFLLGHANAEVTSKYAITNAEMAKANHKKLM